MSPAGWIGSTCVVRPEVIARCVTVLILCIRVMRGAFGPTHRSAEISANESSVHPRLGQRSLLRIGRNSDTRVRPESPHGETGIQDDGQEIAGWEQQPQEDSEEHGEIIENKGCVALQRPEPKLSSTANRTCGWVKPKKRVSSGGRKLTAYCRKVAAKK